MKRISYWTLSTLSAVVLLFSYRTSTSGPDSAAPGSTTAPVVIGSSPSPRTSTANSTKSSARTAKKATKTTKTITGPAASTQWGPVQVQLSVTDGTITKVSVLQYPSGNGRDAQINSYALPILVKETLTAQSASIDMVSGATVTSGGYLTSLQSALDQAKL